MEINKKSLRLVMARRRAELTPDQAADLGAVAQKAILASPFWDKAGTVALFSSLPGEISTKILCENAWQKGKKVLLPKVINRHRGEMDFFVCSGPAELRPGPWGILEPETGQKAPACDLLLLPGLAFDLAGRRLGYGGGFYDRFLHRRPDFAAKKIGFCFALQIVPEIPCEDFDVPVDAICSEAGLKWL